MQASKNITVDYVHITGIESGEAISFIFGEK